MKPARQRASGADPASAVDDAGESRQRIRMSVNEQPLDMTAPTRTTLAAALNSRAV